MARHRAGRPRGARRLLLHGGGPILNALTGWLLFGALIGAWGAVVGRWLLTPGLPEPARARLEAVAAGLGVAAGIGLVVAMGLVFWRQLAEFRDPFAPLREDADLLLRQTDWGGIWLWATAGAIATPFAFALARRARGAWLAVTGLVAAMCAFPAYTGHASGMEELRWLSIPADVLHVLAAGAWMGGLFFVLLAERSVRRRPLAVTEEGAPRADSILPELVRRFSPVALVSVAVLVVTGSIASWLHVESWALLVESTYGRLLLAKLVLVAGVLGLGALNWRRLTPRLGTAEGAAALRRAATAELVLAHVVILVTALLVRTSPLHDWSWTTIGH